uniref:NADH dehydrogenase subunit 6 n=1 Tax=Ramaria rubella TaxID=113071 RepID=UPI00223709AF|nr:NADH dehydrogenase subunit 6 [Ramaria rubella]UYR22248.1 NADH dehydrogenase subunit 6 [Ramaria rubella]
MNNFLLDLLAFSSILSSILVITSKNPVVAVIYLISVFINASGYLLILGVGFVGISYILLYVGAITVLFLFVLMSINIKLTDILEAGAQYTKNIPLALCIGLLFTYELINISPFSINNVAILELPFIFITNLNQLLIGTDLAIGYNILAFNPMLETFIASLTHIESLGQELYTHGAIWLMICSTILLLALVAPIFISRNNKSVSFSSSNISE